jgi:hypothetical protein
MMYPVEPVQAGLKWKEAVKTAFDYCRDIYPSGIDFDFMDFQSLDRAVINNKHLEVSEKYKVLILPAMSAVRHSTTKRHWSFIVQVGMCWPLAVFPKQAIVSEVMITSCNDD